MDSLKKYEKLKQKIRIKELNGMDTLDEQTKELILILDEFIKTTSPRDVKSLIEETEKEEYIINKVVGDSTTFPLAAIEKLLPFTEMLFARVLSDTSDKTNINLLNHACDDMATYSMKLVPDNTKIPSDKAFELSEMDAIALDKETLIKTWAECVNGVLGQIRNDLKNKDNIMLCSHCYHLWSHSNISTIFFTA